MSSSGSNAKDAYMYGLMRSQLTDIRDKLVEENKEDTAEYAACCKQLELAHELYESSIASLRLCGSHTK